MSEIMSGKSCYFPGLLPLCYAYLEHIGCDEVSFRRLDTYLKFIKERAEGTLMTPAAWMRNFVRTHPDYKKDSVVSESIAFDLVHACNDIGLGKRDCPEILGEADCCGFAGAAAHKTTQFQFCARWKVRFYHGFVNRFSFGYLL